MANSGDISFDYPNSHFPMFTYSDKIIWANDAALKFFELDDIDQVLYRRFEDFAPDIQPDGQSITAKIDFAINTAMKDDSAVIRLQFYSQSQRFKYAEITVMRLPEKFLFVFHDVTSYMERELELRYRINRLERAIATGSDSVWQLNTDLRTFYFFPSLYKLLGYSTNKSSMMIEDFVALVNEDDRVIIRSAYADFLAPSFRERNDEIRLRNANGQNIWFWFRGTLETLGTDGKPLVISGTVTNVQAKKESEKHLLDQTAQLQKVNKKLAVVNKKLRISEENLTKQYTVSQALNDELRMANAELMQATKRAEESDSLKTSFLENLSHEFRTPMNGIIGFADLLRDDDVDESDKLLYIDIIRNSAKQLLGIVTDVMEISKIDTGQISARVNEVNVFKTALEVYKIIQKQAELNKDIVFDFICATEVRDIVIVSDEVKLKQVFTNLMNNALKYTKRGYIRVRLAQEDGNIVFSVEDTGCGIKPENMSMIFLRFVRLEDSDTKGTTNGAGLGLAIAKSYIELLGGTIDVQSEYGKGSTFTVKLPCNH